MPILDLSHIITNAISTHPGLPGPALSTYLSFEDSRSHYADGTEFHIGRVEMVTSTGTYLDAPLHRFPDGASVAAVALERCVNLPAVVVDTRHHASITPDLIPAGTRDRAVLFYTGWDQHWGTSEYVSPDHPHLTPAAAEHLATEGATLVGIDSVNIDATTGAERPIHTTLLRAGVLIVENLTNLAALPRRGARLHAAPLPMDGMPSFPVRAYAVTQGREPDPVARPARLSE